MKVFRLSALALSATLACAAATAQAQEAAPAPGAAERHAWDPAAMRQHMEAHRAERLKALHDALNIRPDQEAAFQAFASAMAPEDHGDWKQHERDEDRAGMAALTTPERVDRMEQKMDQRMAQRREAMHRRGAALKALYAVLSPEQRRTLDALPGLAGHGHEGMRGRHGMG